MRTKKTKASAKLVPHVLMEFDYETIYKGRVSQNKVQMYLRTMDLEYYTKIGARLRSAQIYWMNNEL